MIPKRLIGSLAGLALVAGIGTSAYVHNTPETTQDPYIQTISNSGSISTPVKIAMIIGYEFEASNQLRLTPYRAPEGNWTVCTGLTVATIGYFDPSAVWTTDDCFDADSRVYQQIEAQLKKLHPNWNEASVWTQAATIDFVYNVGIGQYKSSTMKLKFDAGDFEGACLQHPRWNKARVNGILKVLTGLKNRRDAVSEICLW